MWETQVSKTAWRCGSSAVFWRQFWNRITLALTYSQNFLHIKNIFMQTLEVYPSNNASILQERIQLMKLFFANKFLFMRIFR